MITLTPNTAEAGEQRGTIRRLCPEFGLEAPSIQCDFFAEFARRQGWTPEKNPDRLAEWGRRFKQGTQFHYSDREHAKVLLDILVEGPGDGTAPHVSEGTAAEWCKKVLAAIGGK